MNGAELSLSLLTSGPTRSDLGNAAPVKVASLLQPPCVEIAGHKMLLHNESSEKSDTENGIYVGANGVTYFSPCAAFARISEKFYIPTDEDWRKMAQEVGGWEKLRNILRISFDGVYSVNQARQCAGSVSSFNDQGILKTSFGGGIVTLHTGTKTIIPSFCVGHDGEKIPAKDILLYPYVFFTERPYNARVDRVNTLPIDSGIFRDHHTPLVYWNVLRMAQK